MGERRGWAVAEGLALQGRPVVCQPAGTWAHLNSTGKGPGGAPEERAPAGRTQQPGRTSPLPCFSEGPGRGGQWAAPDPQLAGTRAGPVSGARGLN